MRFEARENLGMWMVMDSTTGEIAKVNDTWMESMNEHDAVLMAELLNKIEATRTPKNN